MNIYYVCSEERPLRRMLCRVLGHDMRVAVYGTADTPNMGAPRCHRCDGYGDLFFMPRAVGLVS